MENEEMGPHSAVVQLNWEIHQKKMDGSYYGSHKGKGKLLIIIDGDNLAITRERLNNFIDLIKGGKDVVKSEDGGTGHGQARIQGTLGQRNDNSQLFVMRGGIGKDSTS